jgi:nitroreductase
MKKNVLVFLVVFLVTAIAAHAKGLADNGQTLPTEQSSGIVIDQIMRSFSPALFKASPVSDDIVETILQSGQKAPSASNAQPWHFTVVKDTETASQLSRHYKEGAVVIVISGKVGGRWPPAFDCALAAQYMSLTAQSLGLGVRMYYNSLQNVNNNRSGLSIPDGYDAQIVLLVGYIDDSVDAVTSASQRRPLSENVNYIK